MAVSGASPNLVTLRVYPIPMKYAGGIGFANHAVMVNALKALPLIGLPGFNQYLDGQIVKDPATGLLTQVKTVKEDELSANGDEHGRSVDCVNDTVVKAVEDHFSTDSQGEFTYDIQPGDVSSIFGDTSPYGRMELVVRREPIPSSTLPQDAAGGSTSEQMRYVMNIWEYPPGGSGDGSDRIETSLAALLGLHRGIYGIGIRAYPKESVGFDMDGDEDEVLALPFNRLLYGLDEVVNTDMVEASVIASALYTGSQYLDLGELPIAFAPAVFFGTAVLPIGQQGATFRINAAFRLFGFDPAPVTLDHKMDSGLLTVRRSKHHKRGALELLLLPQGLVTFSEMDIQIIHEVAKKCRDLMIQFAS